MDSLINKISLNDGNNLTTTYAYGDHINVKITSRAEANLNLSREDQKINNFSSVDLTRCIDIVKKINNIPENITPISIIATYSQSFNNRALVFNTTNTPGVIIIFIL